LTGWAQINGWRGELDTQEKLQNRVECDLYYNRELVARFRPLHSFSHAVRAAAVQERLLTTLSVSSPRLAARLR
jgi:hypothetical protein